MQALPSLAAGHRDAPLHAVQSTVHRGDRALSLAHFQTASVLQASDDVRARLLIKLELPPLQLDTLRDDTRAAILGVHELVAQGGRAADHARDALGNALSPLDLFQGSYFLDVLLLGTVGLLAYSLIIAAPRQ